jgi:hypothetical protein
VTSFRGCEVPNKFPGLAPGKRVYGSLRLLDVKPPCSNLAGAFGYRPISCAELPPGTGHVSFHEIFSAARSICGSRVMSLFFAGIARLAGGGGRYGPGAVEDCSEGISAYK